MELMVNDNLREYMRELREVRDNIKKLTETQKEIMYMISHEMKDNEIVMDQDGLVLATYKKSFRSNFDTTAFKEQLPATYQKFVKQVETRTFLFKE